MNRSASAAEPSEVDRQPVGANATVGRLWVVVAAACLAGTLLVPAACHLFRPYHDRSTLRLRIEQIGGEASESRFLTRCQLLTSRRLLQRVVDSLGLHGKAVLGEEEPVAALARRISVRPIPHTRVVVVTAAGRDRLFPVRLLDELVKAFREELRFADQGRAAAEEARLRQEIHFLEAAGAGRAGVKGRAAGGAPGGVAGGDGTTTVSVAPLLAARREALVRVRLEEEVAQTLVTTLDGPTLPPAHRRVAVAWEAAAGAVGGLLVAVAGLLLRRLAARPSGDAVRGELAALTRAIGALAPATRPLPSPVAEGVALPPPLTGEEVASLLAATAGPLDRNLFERALLGVPTLLVNTAGPLDVAIGALLSGLTVEEVVGLRWSQVHLGEGIIHLPGAPPTPEGGGDDGRLRRRTTAPPRLVDLSEPVQLLFIEARKPAREGDDVVVAQGDGRPIGVADLDALLLCTAYDAGLDRPERVTAEAIRHTFLAHLVRQGLRLADLPRVAGPLPPAVLASYARMAPPGPALSLERLDLTPPGFRPLQPSLHGPAAPGGGVGAIWEG